MYKNNIGSGERIVRLFIAIVLIVINFLFNFNLAIKILLFLVGGILLLSAIFNQCPACKSSNDSFKNSKLNKVTQEEIRTAINEYKLNNVKLNDSSTIDEVQIKKTTKKDSKKKNNKKVGKEKSKTKSSTKKELKTKTTTKSKPKNKEKNNTKKIIKKAK